MFIWSVLSGLVGWASGRPFEAPHSNDPTNPIILAPRLSSGTILNSAPRITFTSPRYAPVTCWLDTLSWFQSYFPTPRRARRYSNLAKRRGLRRRWRSINIIKRNGWRIERSFDFGRHNTAARL